MQKNKNNLTATPLDGGTSNQVSHQCEFCLKKFTRESSLINHSCVKKTRWMQMNNPLNLIAFDCWEYYYKKTTVGKKLKTYRQFIESNYFNDFVKCARFMVDNQIKNKHGFLDYLINHQIKLSDWSTNSSLVGFVQYRALNEHPIDAIERTVNHICVWTQQHDCECDQYYSKVSPNRVVNDLMNGHISPWLVYSSLNAQLLIDRLDDQQLQIVSLIINPVVWRSKLKRHQKEIAQIEKLLGEIGL